MVDVVIIISGLWPRPRRAVIETGTLAWSNCGVCAGAALPYEPTRILIVVELQSHSVMYLIVFKSDVVFEHGVPLL